MQPTGTLNLVPESPVIRGIESEEEWLTHREDVTRGLNPVGPAEEAVAEELAVLLWRQRQAFRLQEYLRRQVAAEHSSPHAAHLERLAAYNDHLDCRMARAYLRLDTSREERLRRTQAMKPASATPGSLRDSSRPFRKRSSVVLPRER